MNAIAALGIALAISLMGNLWLFNSRDDALTQVGETKTALSVSNETAKLCSASVAQLEEDAKAAKRASDEAIALAREQGKGAQAKGIATLSTPRSKPADKCASVDDLVDGWFKKREFK